MHINWLYLNPPQNNIPVKVYKNLKTKKWSIQATQGPLKGKVIAYAHSFVLADAIPKVSEASRQRVIRTRQKNVHAFLQGTLLLDSLPPQNLGPEVTYHPYSRPDFYYPINNLGIRNTPRNYFFHQNGKVYEIP